MLNEKIQNIINTPVSLANEVLYSISENTEKYSWQNGDFFGEKIWLIGRSYAASPERRYKKINSEDTLKLDNIGDGTGKYFMEVGNYIVRNEAYKELLQDLEKLQSEYKFDGSVDDIELLETAINTVTLLNEMVKEASEQYDKERNPQIVNKVVYKNQISFCSKFLHFHCPHTVFIIDHFTKEAADKLFSSASKKRLHFESAEITRNFKNQLISNLPKSSISDALMKDYINHCKKSYALCCFIKNNASFNKDKIEYYPRTSDYLFQQLKSD